MKKYILILISMIFVNNCYADYWVTTNITGIAGDGKQFWFKPAPTSVDVPGCNSYEFSLIRTDTNGESYKYMVSIMSIAYTTRKQVKIRYEGCNWFPNATRVEIVEP